MNRTAVFGIALLLMLVGLFLPGRAGAAVLLALAAAVLALMVRAPREVPPALRLTRLLVMVLLVGAALLKIA